MRDNALIQVTVGFGFTSFFCESGASFAEQSQTIVGQNQSKRELLQHPLEAVLTCDAGIRPSVITTWNTNIIKGYPALRIRNMLR